ncbi:MAG: FAD-dependent oxidoreductase [Candidatus Kapabacteria bacterium]|nr:FAD-dependent oxidoreductase [Candidatus Kapabacteria bacterium]
MKNIAIIGAGIAGISTAIYLSEFNCEITLFEKKSFLGGRSYSFIDKISNEELNYGEHLLSESYSLFLGILRVLGTDNNLIKQKSLRVPFISGASSYILDCSRFRGKLGLVYGILSLKDISLISKIKTLQLIRNLASGAIEITNMSCSEMLNNFKIPNDIIYKFWEPLIYAVLNLNPSEAAATLLAKVFELSLNESGKSGLIFPSVGLSALIEPFKEYAKKMNCSILLNAEVKQIIFKNGFASGIRTVLGEEYEFDAVVFAANPELMPKLWTDASIEYLEFLNALEYSTIICVHLWLDEEISELDFAAMLGTQSQWIFNMRKYRFVDDAAVAKYPHHYSIIISGANHLDHISNDEIIKIVFDDILSLFPKFQEAKILHKQVMKIKKSTIKITPFINKLRPETKTSIPNLFLAGDWTQTMLPATIEGACQSALNVKAEILKLI